MALCPPYHPSGCATGSIVQHDTLILTPILTLSYSYPYSTPDADPYPNSNFNPKPYPNPNRNPNPDPKPKPSSVRLASEPFFEFWVENGKIALRF